MTVFKCKQIHHSEHASNMLMMPQCCWFLLLIASHQRSLSRQHYEILAYNVGGNNVLLPMNVDYLQTFAFINLYV